MSGIGTAILGYCGYRWFWQATPLVTPTPSTPEPIVPVQHEHNNQPPVEQAQNNENNQPLVEQPSMQGNVIAPANANVPAQAVVAPSELQNIRENLHRYNAPLRDVRAQIAGYIMSDHQRQDMVNLFHNNAPTIVSPVYKWFLNPVTNQIVVKERKDINSAQYHCTNGQFTRRALPTGFVGITTTFHTNGSYVEDTLVCFRIYNQHGTLLHAIPSPNNCFGRKVVWDDSGNYCALISQQHAPKTVLHEATIIHIPSGTRLDCPHRKYLKQTGYPSFSSSDGNKAAYVGRDRKLKIVDLTTRNIISLDWSIHNSFYWHTNDVLIKVAKDLLDRSNDNIAWIDATNGSEHASLTIPDLQNIIVSHDKTSCLVISDREISILDLTTRELVKLADNNNPEIPVRISWNLDNTLLALCQGARLQIWDTQTKQLKYEFIMQPADSPATKTKLAWTTDNKLAYGTVAGTVRYINGSIRNDSIRLLDIPALDRLMDAFNRNPIRFSALLCAKLQQQAATAVQT